MDFCLWMLLPTRKVLHFTSLGLKENYSSCTGAKGYVCLSLCGWFVPLGPRQHRGAGKLNYWHFSQPLPASAVAPVLVPAGFKPLGLLTGFAPLCPALQLASVMSQRGCAGPAVPFPRACSEQVFAQRLLWGCVLELPENWAKLGGGRHSFFP